MSHGHHQHSAENHEAPDTWHAHGPGEVPQSAHAEAVDVPQVIAVGIAGFLLIVAAIVATIIYFNWYANGLLIRKVERADLYSNTARVDFEYSEYRKRIEAELANYNVIDAAKKTASTPIDLSKKKIAESLAK